MTSIIVSFFIVLSMFPREFERYIPKDFVLRKAPRTAAITPAVIARGSVRSKKICLTFDACENRYKTGFDTTVAEELIRQKIPATIFVSGRWALDHQQVMRMLSSFPYFEFGNHSFIHPHCTHIPVRRFEDEVDLTQDVIFSLTGKVPVLFRSPYGEYDDTMVTVLASRGISLVEYNLPSGDPDSNATAKKLIDYVSAKTNNGAIIVMHINKRGWHTAEALPKIIEELRKKKFEFVTVSDLVKVRRR
ncbi:MAG: polysaccharide deacetylase family protein [Bacteroidota bacterium]